MEKQIVTENEAKAIVEETGKVSGLTEEGERFLSLYLDRIREGKRFASMGQGLRFAKSEETLAFWGNYAISSQGFGGIEVFKAPVFNKSVLEERLKLLGWRNKRLPSGYVAFAKKHKISLTDFEKACYDQEQASRKAADREEVPTVVFPDAILDFFVDATKDDNSLPLGKIIIALETQVRKKLAGK